MKKARFSEPRLIAELRPFKNDGETCEYVDIVARLPGQSIRIYVYRMGPTKFPKEEGLKRIG
jgi:hypothetical protein